MPKKITVARRGGKSVPRPRTRSLLRVTIRLQRWWRTARRFVPTNNTDDSSTRWRVRANGKDARCPISQDAITLPLCFRFVSASRHVFAFSLDSLVAYLRSSGRFRCPCTQESFNSVVVSRIERRAIAAGVTAQGLRGVFEMRSAVLHREIEHSNRLLAYENSCGADLEEAIEICADDSLTRDRALRYLQRDVLPQWRQTCNEYLRLSRTACMVMLQSNAERLRRLSSIDDADVHGLLHLVIDEVDNRLRVADNTRYDLSAFDFANVAITARDSLRWLGDDLRAVIPPHVFGNSPVGFGNGMFSPAGRQFQPPMSLLGGQNNFMSFNIGPVAASILGLETTRTPSSSTSSMNSGGGDSR